MAEAEEFCIVHIFLCCEFNVSGSGQCCISGCITVQMRVVVWVYVVSVLGLFSGLRGTLLLPSSGWLNLFQVDAEVIGCKKMCQLCRKV
jgi:uncharacterized oligopeptide transporter (OPT) family protein